MICVGDIHGNFTRFITNCVGFDIKDELIIQVGDFGLGFPYREDDRMVFDENKILTRDAHNLSMLNDVLSKRNTQLNIIRGNHDNPNHWDKHNFTNIKFITDGSIIETSNKRIFVFGGGISIDRAARRLGFSCWKDEGVNYDLVSKLIPSNIDVVISHIPPITYYSAYLNPNVIAPYIKMDHTIEDDMKKDNENIMILHDLILLKNPNLEYWISGHLHLSKRIYTDDKKYISLDIDEWYKIIFD